MDHYEEVKLFEDIKQKISLLNPNLRVNLYELLVESTRDQIFNRNEKSRLKSLKEKQDEENEYFIRLIQRTDTKYVDDLKKKSSFIKGKIYHMEQKFGVKNAIIQKYLHILLSEDDECSKTYIEIRNKKFEKLCDEIDHFLDLEMEEFYNKYTTHKYADPIDELYTTCHEHS